MTLRIVVTGMAATFPFGGVFWDYLQYPLGLHQLGHDVLYLEDTGKWCYDPSVSAFVPDGDANAKCLASNLKGFMPELAESWHYRDANDIAHGWPVEKVESFCRSADLFIHMSASCIARDAYFEPARLAFVDSDPMYTQAGLNRELDPQSEWDRPSIRFMQWFREHDVFFSFGENVGRADCLIPQMGLRWHPTRQPITFDRFSPHRVPISDRRETLTTVGSWSPREKNVLIDGRSYGAKGPEFERLIDLPHQLRRPMELAISGVCPRDRLTRHGWNPIDAAGVSGRPDVYRDYLAHSFAELSVAKHAYVASNSGWFSCRSACYMAMGVPVVVQDTGFTAHIPTGQGVFAFTKADVAAAAVDAILTDPEAHAQAAQDIARSHFDARQVLQQLIDHAMASPAPVHERAQR